MIDFTSLQSTLRTLDHHFKIEAGKSVNRLLTIRNWLFGFYIFEFQQRGAERAAYGERLLEKLAETMRQKSFSYRNLRLYRQFYLTYPHFASSIWKFLETNSIWQSLIAKLQAVDNQSVEIVQSVIAQFKLDENQSVAIGQTVSAQLPTQIGQTPSDQFESPENQPLGIWQSLIAKSPPIGQSPTDQFQSPENQSSRIVQTPSAQFSPPAEKLLANLSYTQFTLLLTCDTPSNVPSTKSKASGAAGLSGS
ncbi:MAG: DUF1016 N-terminal domain-containing protein [Bacteroidota bacterium]